MTPLMEYGVAFLVVLGVNLLPALAPPTWAVLVALMFAFDLRPLILVPAAASAAAIGRLALALLARRFSARLSPHRIEGLHRLRDLLASDRKRTFAALALFLWSPLPSNELFLAAGLMDVPLRSLTLAFFAGRLVTYTAYLEGATYLRANFGEIWKDHLTSPAGILIQLVMLALLAALLFVDWLRLLGRGPMPPPARGDTAPPKIEE